MVADGMGGHAAGEVASRTAADCVREFMAQAAGDMGMTWPFGMDRQHNQAENLLINGFMLANRKLGRLAEENTQYAGMGTTLAALYIPDARLHVAHVGDSRIYRLRQGELEPLTIDHSWVNEQLQRNIITEDEARSHRWRNVITRALGNREEIEVDVKTLDPAPNDLYLICSDGLTGMMDDDRISQILLERGEDLEAACKALVEAANDAGGNDNISAVLVRILSTPCP